MKWFRVGAGLGAAGRMAAHSCKPTLRVLQGSEATHATVQQLPCKDDESNSSSSNDERPHTNFSSSSGHLKPAARFPALRVGRQRSFACRLS